MIGNNACGSRALGYGRTVDNVLELDVVTGSGERVVAGPEASGNRSALATAAMAAVDTHRATIETELDRFSSE